ncbi:MAG: hypothetical protein WC004_04925, partial [Candidatus Absconditabacterales bacterium]
MIKTVIACAMLCSLVMTGISAFAQYGGGGGGGGGSFGGSPGVFALNRDVCPNGDFSPSFYDGNCGNGILAQQTDLLVTGPDGSGTNTFGDMVKILITKQISVLNSVVGQPEN